MYISPPERKKGVTTGRSQKSMDGWVVVELWLMMSPSSGQGQYLKVSKGMFPSDSGEEMKCGGAEERYVFMTTWLQYNDI